MFIHFISGLEEQGTGLLKYAISHLILDVIEAESHAVPKLSESSKNQLSMKAKDSKASEISEELDLLCMRHTGYHFADIVLRGKFHFIQTHSLILAVTF